MNTYGIFRREPNGVWTNVEPQGHQAPSLAAVVAFYHDTYLHDDAEGTEVLFTAPPVGNAVPPRMGLYRVSIPKPEPEATLVLVT